MPAVDQHSIPHVNQRTITKKQMHVIRNYQTDYLQRQFFRRSVICDPVRMVRRGDLASLASGETSEIESVRQRVKFWQAEPN